MDFKKVFDCFFVFCIFTWQFLFFFIPLSLILVFSVVNPGGVGFGALTIKYFVSVLNLDYARIILRSLFFAFLVSFICLLAAYPFVYYLIFTIKRLRLLFLFLIFLPFGINFLLHVYAWFFILGREGYINSFLLNLGVIERPLHILNTHLATTVVMIYSYFPFMVLPLYLNLDRFNFNLVEASLDLGAGWFQTIRRVIIPISLPGILSGFLLVFIPAFGEFAIPELLGGDKKMFVGSVISYHILNSRTMSHGAAMTLISAILLSFFAYFLFFLSKKIKDWLLFISSG